MNNFKLMFIYLFWHKKCFCVYYCERSDKVTYCKQQQLDYCHFMHGCDTNLWLHIKMSGICELQDSFEISWNSAVNSWRAVWVEN